MEQRPVGKVYRSAGLVAAPTWGLSGTACGKEQQEQVPHALL